MDAKLAVIQAHLDMILSCTIKIENENLDHSITRNALKLRDLALLMDEQVSITRVQMGHPLYNAPLTWAPSKIKK